MTKDIYIIKNDLNNKVYIGQAKNSKERFQSHCKPSAATLNNELIGKAIQKYGREHFWFEILEHQIADYNEKEKYYIEQFNSIVPNGYNLTNGGEMPPIKKGADHPESKLNKQQVEQLTIDLQTTNISFVELAKKYGFNSNTSISEFNKGLTYVRNISYPIRKEALIGKLNSTHIAEIIQLLKTTYRSFESIGTQYGVEARTISRINRGLLHRQEIEYPIRLGRVGASVKLTYEQVTEIINDLINTNLSLRAIASAHNCEYKDVLGIKNGTTKLYRRRGLTYPLRPNN